MKIAICDDNKNDLKRVVNSIFRLTEYSFEYDIYVTPEELLLKIIKDEVVYDIYIFDIEMPKINGLKLAREIRKHDVRALFVFLTSHTKYMSEVFEVITFDYIIKPFTDTKLKEMIEKAMNHLNLINKNFSFSYCKHRFSLKFDEIIYFEKRGRQANIYSKESIYKTNMTLANIWGQLDENMFVAIHKSIIINLKYVKTIINSELSMSDGTQLFISKGYRKNLALKHYSFTKSGM